MKPEGDQVGTPNGPSPRPWELPFMLARLRELGYALLSWPYIIAVLLTVNYVAQVWLRSATGPHAINLQAMLGGWTLAFARREFASWMAGRQQPTGKPGGI